MMSSSQRLELPMITRPPRVASCK